jgi:26S proteasome regulatory subunit N9
MSEMTYLNQKVKIIAFLEMVFLCGKDERDIPFAKIADACILETSDVELLVMKAMSLELVRGTIDEVAETVQVDWILPRYLNKDHLQVLCQRMREWEDKMEGVIMMLESKSDELLAQ